MKTLALWMIVAGLLVAACAAPSATVTTPAPPTATPEPAPPTATPEPAPAGPTDTPAAQPSEPDLAAICPAETEGTALHVSPENGWCFLYPSNLRLEPDALRPEEAVTLLGEPLDPNATESVAITLSVANNGPADGLDSAQYANMWLDLNMPGMDPLERHATIGGQPAVIFDTLPGSFPRQGAFIVANDTRYQIVLQPRPGDVPELDKQAAQAWDTVTQSIVFFPPQNERVVVRPGDVCPEETEGATLHVNPVDGYCLLLPEGFAIDPGFPARFVGGPELGPV